MSGVIIALRFVMNQVENTLIVDITDPYNPTILAFVKELFCPSSPDVIFLPYYNVAASHRDFGQPRGANNKPNKGMLLCKWKGVFIATGKNGIRQFTVSDDSHSSYLYLAGLSKLLADYAAKTGEAKFAISFSIEKKFVVEDQLRGLDTMF